MKCFKLFSQGDHRWLAFGQDRSRPDSITDTVQVVVTAGNNTMLLDPGGIEIFPSMMGALVHEIDMETVRHIFLSHQDPDVGSGLALWRQVAAPGTVIHLAQLWTGYVSHFDAEAKFAPIPDQGGEVQLSGSVRLRLLPAHYLHSPANFCVYDPVARVLFSGDIGAAQLPGEKLRDIWVSNFAEHVQYMSGFHRRFMGSREARDAWIEMVSALAIDVIVPQHGLAFRGPDVRRFLDWFAELPIGSGLEAFGNRAARK
ncbi:MAG: MBL fold metallo-hydrolase [Azospirillum sp.]|nr:MBL fold metallo-hydrolase [Azospirillum sp.]